MDIKTQNEITFLRVNLHFLKVLFWGCMCAFESEEIGILNLILRAKMFWTFLEENLLICGMTSISRCHLSDLTHPYSFRSSVVSPRKLSVTTTHATSKASLSVPIRAMALLSWHVLFLCVWPRFGWHSSKIGMIFYWIVWLYLVLHSQCLAQRTRTARFLTCHFWFVIKCPKSVSLICSHCVIMVSHLAPATLVPF